MSFLSRLFPRIQNPLLFVVGDDATSNSLVACLDHILHSNIKGLDLDFITQTPEQYNVSAPSPCKDGKSSVNTILKEDWIEKHALQRPSVVIFHFPFDINWSDSDWSAKESVLQQQYVNIVSGTGQRQCVVLVLAVQPGNATKVDLNALFSPPNAANNRPQSIKAGTAASSEALENSSYSSKGESSKNNDPIMNRLRNRLQAFIGSLQVDRDSFFMSNEEDLVVDTNPAQVPRMLLQRTLNCGSYYYKYQVDKANSRMEKRVSTVLMNGNKTGRSLDDITLLAFIKAKYNFKIAHMYDIQKKPEQSIVYYRKVFESLMNVAENVDEEEKENQVKRMMELCNFRICQRLMKQGHAMTAANQMEMLMNTWKGILDHFTISDNDAKRKCYMHYKWMVRQYIIFIDLLTVHRNRGDIRFSSSNTSTIPSKGLPPIVKGQEFSHNLSEYYLLAAEYSIKQQEMYSRMHGETPTKSQVVRIAFDDVYSFEDASTNSSSNGNMKENEDKESFGDCVFYNHLSVVIGFLNKALQEVPASHMRRKVYVISLLTDQLITNGDFDNALMNIKQTLAQGKICTKKWIPLAIPLLKKAMSCSIYLGRPREYLDHALILYSLASNSHLGRLEREELHRDVLSMTTSYGNTFSTTADEPSTAAKDLSPSLQSLKQYVGIPYRPEFGMAASATHPTEYILPSSYALQLSSLPGSPTKMFDIEVYFDNSQPMIVGDTIRVELTVTSLFYSKMQFERMEVNWTNDCCCTRFVHDENGNVDSSAGGDIAANLNFAPNSTLKFAFDVHLSQSDLHRKAPRNSSAPASPSSPTDPGVQDVEDWYVYIEKINFVLRSQYSTGLMNQLKSQQKAASTNARTTGAVRRDSIPVSSDSDMQQHDFVFQVNMVPEEVSSAAKNTQELGLPLKDMHDYVKTASGLNESTEQRHMRVMHVTAPDLDIDMLYPPASSQDSEIGSEITLLTGPVQQVNVVFSYHSDDKSMMQKHKLQLRASSDSKSSTAVSSIFFYPHVDHIQYAPSNDSEKDEKWLDYVEFYSVPLDVHSTTSSGQAVTEPMLIQVDRASEGDTFCLPLFLRSGLSGSVKIKLILEIDCSDDKEMLRYKPREFEVTAKFVKSFQMSFIMDSQSEVRGGMDVDSTSTTTTAVASSNENKNPSISSSSVLCEDMISMTAKLSCLHALHGCVDLLAMTLIGYESIHSTFSSKSKSTKRYFDIHDKDSTGNYDMLTTWNQLTDTDNEGGLSTPMNSVNVDMTSLREGETYSGCAVLVCHSDRRYSVYAREAQVDEDEATDDEDDISGSKEKNSERTDVFSAGVGNVEVLWRLSDPCFLRKVDMKTYNTAISGKVSEAHIITSTNAIAAFMEWLPPIKNFQRSIDKSSDTSKGKQQSMSNTAVDICTRVSALQFSIPLIQVVDPPFDVTIDMPTEWNVTVFSTVHIRVRNKMWTPERIQVLVDASEYFSVCGIEKQSFMIEPRGEVRLKVEFEPLTMGPVPFTNILIKWNKTGANIYKSKRVVFILPYNPQEEEKDERDSEVDLYSTYHNPQEEEKDERDSEVDLYSTYQRRSSIVGMETPFKTTEYDV